MDKKSLYPLGPQKAAYGTFVTALTTLWLHDKLVDELALSLNVIWNRTTPTVVMGGVSEGMAYVHCPDPAMGMNIQGDSQNVRSFRFLCSLMLSEIENAALSGTGLNVGSTFSEIISGIMEGKIFEMVRDGSMVTIMLEDDPNSKIVIDTSTGLVWDLTESNGFWYKGAISQGCAYCYHDQLTNMAVNTVSNLITTLNSAGTSVLSVLGGVIDGTKQFVVDNWNHFTEIGLGLSEMVFGIKTVPTGVITGPIGIAFILKGEGDVFIGIRNWLVPSDYWQYFSYHNPWPNYKTVYRLNNTTHMFDTIEVPIKNGEEDWENAVYISATDAVIS